MLVDCARTNLPDNGYRLQKKSLTVRVSPRRRDAGGAENKSSVHNVLGSSHEPSLHRCGQASLAPRHSVVI